MPEQAAANWYRDPFGRHELRYWDGGQWTQHVVSRGRQEIDPPVGGSLVPTISRAGKKDEQEVRRAGVVAGAQVGDGRLFTEPVLVVAQKPKLFEINVEYTVYDQHGQQIGAVREVGQSILKKALSTQPDSRRARTLQVVDVNGRVRMVMTRPSTIFRSKMMVRDPSGAEIGQIAQKNLGILKVHFSLESRGEPLGSINGEDWESSAFNIQNRAGDEIARISKTWAGQAKEMFMKGENYVVQIHRPLDEPLRSLVIASSLAIDAALRRNSPEWLRQASAHRHRYRTHWWDGDG